MCQYLNVKNANLLRLHWHIGILAYLLIFSLACGREEMRQTIPLMPVNFTVDLNRYDHSLRNPLSYKTFTRPRLQTDLVGLGGLLIVSSMDGNQIFAFDLACPCEGRRDVLVTPTANGTAICATCNSVFNTSFGLGTVQSGVTRVPLQRYTVQQQGEGIFWVRN